ncbi:MAG TPA: SagB/ThcOx family dehydrogenase [Candidatus Sulfomarinibacteraceae bacterium]|nr:SagB/ThcOx family dehydrogenase [Candidatus Sulfomarinibacteraceae bacterium]
MSERRANDGQPEITKAFVEEAIARNRAFLRADLWAEWKIRDMGTDERHGVPAPPLQKPYDEQAPRIPLVPPESFSLGRVPLIDVIGRRQSRRTYSAGPLTLEELSFLLWATQGVHKIIREGKATARTVPSGGARHPFETYPVVNNVEGLEPGIYRYLPLSHELLLEDTPDNLPEAVHRACLQPFVAEAAVVFVWSVIPYRSEWRYSFLSHKVIAQETGHLGQNLYLASEAIGAGACVLGTYDQEAIDALLGLDGEDEFVIYIAAVGKLDE